MTIDGFPKLTGTSPAWGEIEVHPVTGMVTLREMDYGVRDMGESFCWERIYVASPPTENPVPGLLGSRWVTAYTKRLRRTAAKIWLPLDIDQWGVFALKEGHWQRENAPAAYNLQLKGPGYVLRDNCRGKEYSFDDKGRLLSVEKGGAGAKTFSYCGEDLTAILLASGKKIHTLCREGRLTSMTDVLWRKLQYEYQGTLLTKVIYPNSYSVEYGYDVRGCLTSSHDNSGLVRFSLTYDEQDRVIGYMTAEGDTYTYNYREQERLTVVKNSFGGERRYYYNRKGDIERTVYEDGREAAFAYDESHRLVYRRDPGGLEQRLAYDEYGNLLREETPLGLVVEYRYDERGRLIGQEDNLGGEETYLWNGQGWLQVKQRRLNIKNWREEIWERDMRGRTISYSLNGDITRYAYTDASPLPQLMETSAGDKFSFVYDQVWRLTAIKSPYGIREFGYDVLDLMTADTDALGNSCFYQYDLTGKLLTEKHPPTIKFPGRNDTVAVTTAPNETYNQERFSFKLDAKGNLCEVRLRENNDLVLKLDYDVGGRLLKQRLRNNDLALFHLTAYKYNVTNNLTEKRVWLDWQDETSSRGRIQIIRNTYDSQNRLTVSEDNSGLCWEYTYNALNACVSRKKRFKDGTTQVWQYRYDAAGRLVAEEEKADYAKTGQFWRKTLFKLDKDGNCVGVSFPDGREATGEAAERLYMACQVSLPQYRDLSGYVR